MKELTYLSIMLGLSTALFWFLVLFGVYLTFKMDPIYLMDGTAIRPDQLIMVCLTLGGVIGFITHSAGS